MECAEKWAWRNNTLSVEITKPKIKLNEGMGESRLSRPESVRPNDVEKYVRDGYPINVDTDLPINEKGVS